MKDTVMKKLGLMLVFALAPAPVCVAQSQLAGEWHGTLNAAGTPFRVIWHAVAGKDGNVTSTLDNLDQGIFGIKVKTITLTNSDLTLSVDDVIQVEGQPMKLRGAYVGTVRSEEHTSELQSRQYLVCRLL